MKTENQNIVTSNNQIKLNQIIQNIQLLNNHYSFLKLKKVNTEQDLNAKIKQYEKMYSCLQDSFKVTQAKLERKELEIEKLKEDSRMEMQRHQDSELNEMRLNYGRIVEEMEKIQQKN